jgi:hypothetical protein
MTTLPLNISGNECKNLTKPPQKSLGIKILGLKCQFDIPSISIFEKCEL